MTNGGMFVKILLVVAILFAVLVILRVTLYRDKPGPIRSMLEERREERIEKRVRSYEATTRGVTNERTYSAGGLERTYRLYTPKSAHEGMPLLIVLHGTYGTGDKMQIGLGFDPYADERGFYVAYPDAYQEPNTTGLLRATTRWNDGRNTLRSTEIGIDDVNAVRRLIDDVRAFAQIDRTRVYVTGASNGGMMTYRLGCEAGDLFAGIAPVIGNIAEPIARSCTPAKPIAVLTINGADDPFVPLVGGEVCKEVREQMCEGGKVVSRDESVKPFVQANGCAVRPERIMHEAMVDDGTTVETLTYRCQTGVAPIISYVVHGMGHVWPPREGQLGERVSGNNSGNLDATKTIVDFFFPKG